MDEPKPRRSRRRARPLFSRRVARRLAIISAAGAASGAIALVLKLLVGGDHAVKGYIVGTMAPVTPRIAAEVVRDSLDAHVDRFHKPRARRGRR